MLGRPLCDPCGRAATRPRAVPVPAAHAAAFAVAAAPKGSGKRESQAILRGVPGVGGGARDQRRIRAVQQGLQCRRAEGRHHPGDRLAIQPLVGAVAALHPAHERDPVAVHAAREPDLLHAGATPSAVGSRPDTARDVESPCRPPRLSASTAYTRAATALRTAAGPARANLSNARPKGSSPQVSPGDPRRQQQREVDPPEGIVHLIQGLAFRE